MQMHVISSGSAKTIANLWIKLDLFSKTELNSFIISKFGHRPKQFDKDYTWIDGQAMGGDITMQWLETWKWDLKNTISAPQLQLV